MRSVSQSRPGALASLLSALARVVPNVSARRHARRRRPCGPVGGPVGGPSSGGPATGARPGAAAGRKRRLSSAPLVVGAGGQRGQDVPGPRAPRGRQAREQPGAGPASVLWLGRCRFRRRRGRSRGRWRQRRSRSSRSISTASENGVEDQHRCLPAPRRCALGRSIVPTEVGAPAGAVPGLGRGRRNAVTAPTPTTTRMAKSNSGQPTTTALGS